MALDYRLIMWTTDQEWFDYGKNLLECDFWSKGMLLNILWTSKKAMEDSRVPTAFLATHWYWPSSDWRASCIARFPPSITRILEKINQNVSDKCTTKDSVATYRLTWSTSNFCPFFLQNTIGSGVPFGGEHSRMAVSPWATRVCCGSALNSSRRTKTKDFIEL